MKMVGILCLELVGIPLLFGIGRNSSLRCALRTYTSTNNLSLRTTMGTNRTNNRYTEQD